MRRKNIYIGICSLALACSASVAFAWSKGGHMVHAAIVYEELRAKDPRVAKRIAEIMTRHPDRGAFEVAINGVKGEERVRRLFAEMARWPDDIRGGAYDHPSWHYSGRPLVDAQRPPAVTPADETSGAALEAFALNARTASNTRLPAGERAIALCWLFHLAGDIHQPLHAADWYSSIYPEGDLGGGRQFVLDPSTRQPVSLHGYWDGAVTELVQTSAAFKRAHELRTKYPRAHFRAIAAKPSARDFASWASESYALAKSQAYARDLSTSPKQEQAPPLSTTYVANSVAVAEQRLTLAGYRFADLLLVLLRD